MKLAFLGITPAALAFAQNALSAGHTVRELFDPNPINRDVLAAAADFRKRADWENLLHEREFDAVIVAGPLTHDTTDVECWQRREDQLRKLVQAGVPLIVIPPVCDAILGFELEMIRRDVKGVILSYYPQAEHAVWREQLDRHKLYEQITVERSLVSRSRGEVQAAFINDLEVLRHYLGPLRRISASGGVLREKARPELTNLSVSIIGTNACSVRWSVVPAPTTAETRFTFYSATGTQSVTLAENAEAAIVFKELGTGQEEHLEKSNGAEVILQQLQLALRGECVAAASWLDSCRNVEAMEAIDRSLERSRTIDLYNEEHSEESSFKATMAVGGCLLLFVTLTVFIGVSMLSVFWQPAHGDGRGWFLLQIGLIVPFAIFLLLQLLSFGLKAHQQRKRAGNQD